MAPLLKVSQRCVSLSGVTTSEMHAVHEASDHLYRVQGKEQEMTRRKKQDVDVRKHLVTVRLNDMEYETVCGSAKEAGMSLSEYFRQQAVFGRIEIHNHIVADFPKLDKLTQQFYAIGNNLNQLTRYFHMGGLKSKAMTDELTRCINEIMCMRKDVMEMAGEYRVYTKTYRKKK